MKASKRCMKSAQRRITICTGASCSRKGGGRAMQMIKEKFGIQENPVSADGSVKLDTLGCSGNCHLAPLVMMDNAFLTTVELAALPAPQPLTPRLRESRTAVPA